MAIDSDCKCQVKMNLFSLLTASGDNTSLLFSKKSKRNNKEHQ